MNKSHLIARLVKCDQKVSAKDAEICVKLILDAMARSLSHGQRIEIRGFGSFCLNHRGPHKGRNPKSGELVQVPAKYVPHFKAGRELRERVAQRKQAPSGVAQAESAYRHPALVDDHGAPPSHSADVVPAKTERELTSLQDLDLKSI